MTEQQSLAALKDAARLLASFAGDDDQNTAQAWLDGFAAALHLAEMRQRYADMAEHIPTGEASPHD